MPAANPIINGFVPEWADVRIAALGLVFTGVRSINYDSDSDGVDVKGTAAEAIARTVGTITHRASMEMYLPDAASFLQALGDDYRRKPIEISVNFSMSDQQVIADVLVGCIIKGISNSHQEGSEALTRKFDLRPFRIKRAGANGVFVAELVTDIIDPFA